MKFGDNCPPMTDPTSSDASKEDLAIQGQTAFANLFHSHGIEERVAPGTTIIEQGEIGRHGFFLKSGKVGIHAMTPFGEVQLATLNAPAIFGEIAALAGLSRTASVKAIEDVTILKMPGQYLLEEALKEPALFVPVVRKLGGELETLNRAIGLYTDALTALEQQNLTEEIMSALTNPPVQMAGFAEVFARFAKEIQAKKKQQEELASASLIQNSFLPGNSELKSLSGVMDIHAHMSAARHVGGDFYDVINLGGGKILIAIGDVCDKGMPASLFMAVVITTLRSVARAGGNVAEIAAAVNSLVCKANTSSMFATAIIAIIDTEVGKVDFCNCGHCPLLQINTNGAITRHEKTGIPLGVFEERAAGMKTIELAPGDLLFLYSDGISEAFNSALEEFGEQRLHAKLSHSFSLNAQKVCEAVLEETAAFIAGAEQSDDITCLAVRRL